MQFAFGSFNRSVHKHAKAVPANATTKPGRHDRARFFGREEVLRCSS